MDEKYINLKQKKVGFLANGQEWSLDNIKDGLEYFNDLYGHYPTSKEVDNFDYLPSARSIQRSFGGLVQIRKQLNLSGPYDYTKGETRSKQAQDADIRAKQYEEEFFNFLCLKIPEMRIHEHKVIRPGYTSCDFFIYLTDNTGIVVDLFYAADIINVSKVVNIKYKKYIDVQFPVLFIVVGNKNIFQATIDKMIENRKIPLPFSMKVITEENFKVNFDKFIKVNC